ncbi:gliding motility lipoprotein GldB [Flavobacterium sp. Sd200]|uniref:gliding motility lipoprotein GldB n=1 Tax=Flavobacterium sp. Sd200 TaxID=2692211 RepID=UPI00136A2355|nr:gliding motility lipoprotein GldB [Flavobacterium sp. Sd200]MXN91208.1 gliding motility lipoprotein GldB [Flavobacterium sp. Sd200]
MKKYILFIALGLLALSCKKENAVEEKVASVKVGNIDIERFDDAFYNSKPEDLPKLKQRFPYLFPAGNEDTVWTNKIKNPLLQQLHQEVDKKFPDTKKLGQDVYDLMQHIRYYYPQTPTPKVITLISEMDYENRAIYADTLVLLSLDLYLGKNHRFYVDFPTYQRQEFEPTQIMPDLVSAFSYGRIAPPRDRTLLSLMIYYGKELYLKDMLLPDTPDHNKIGYTKEQLDWANLNEDEMWRYFVENKLFYSTDIKLPGRFINPAPFSKFYLGFDNESPGRTGQWLGWQIVRAYMQNNKGVTLQQLMGTDAKTIFENSKYKPKK